MNVIFRLLSTVIIASSIYAQKNEVTNTIRVLMAFSSKTNSMYPHIQILSDNERNVLVQAVKYNYFNLTIPLLSYKVTKKLENFKYCNDTQHFSSEISGQIITFIICSRRNCAKILQKLQLGECSLPWRRIQFILVWRGWYHGQIKIEIEAIRLAILSINSERVVILANQVNPTFPRAILPVNVWTQSAGLLNHPVIPEQDMVYRNLGGRVLRVPILHKPPWYILDQINGSLYIIGGRDHQLLVELATRMNFRFQYLDPPVHSQGSAVRSINSSSDKFHGGGVLNLLHRRLVDLFLGDVALTYERLLDTDFSFFTLADNVAFVTRAPRPVSEALALVRPFQWQVWLAVLVAALAAGPVLHLVTARPGFAPQAHRTGESLCDCIWISVALFLKQSIRVPARTHKSRLIIVLFSLTATYVIGDLYCANLTSLIASPGKELPIRTLDELVRSVSLKRYELLVESRSSALDFLRNGTDESRRLWFLMQKQSRAFVSSVEHGISLVRSQRGLALIAGRETLRFETIRFGEHNFHVSDPLYTRYSAIALQQGCPYLAVLNSIVLRLFEAGVLDRMTSLEYARLGQRSAQDVDKDDSKSQEEAMSVKQLQGAFIILIAGYFIAGLALCAENLINCKIVHDSRRARAAYDVWSKKCKWKRRLSRCKTFLCEVIIDAFEIHQDEN